MIYLFFPVIHHAPVPCNSLQLCYTFCKQREMQADIIVLEVSGCTVSDCTVTSISWTGKPSKGPNKKEKEKKWLKKQTLSFQNIMTQRRKKNKVSGSRLSLSLLLLMSKGMATCYFILSLHSFAYRLITSLFSLSKTWLTIFRIESSWAHSSKQLFPNCLKIPKIHLLKQDIKWNKESYGVFCLT